MACLYVVLRIMYFAYYIVGILRDMFSTLDMFINIFKKLSRVRKFWLDDRLVCLGYSYQNFPYFWVGMLNRSVFPLVQMLLTSLCKANESIYLRKTRLLSSIKLND